MLVEDISRIHRLISNTRTTDILHICTSTAMGRFDAHEGNANEHLDQRF